MSVKKQIKTSKKPAKKKLSTRDLPEHIPDVVQWVLKFLNLRSIPADARKELKRPGVDQCSPTLEDFKQFFLDEGIPPLEGSKLLLENGKTLEKLNTEYEFPETGHTPTYDDYPFELKLLIQISEGVWCELCRILGNMIHATKTYNNEVTAEESFNQFKKSITEKYIECLDDDEIPDKGGKNRGVDFRGIRDVLVDGGSVGSFPHYGMLPQAIYACVLDFSNYKEILSRLKQCPCCGKFRIEEVTDGVRGRKRIHCSDECRKEFGKADKEVNKDSQASSREWKRQAAKKEIISWLCNMKDSPYSRKDAEGIYEKESKSHPNNVASLKAFQNSYGRRFGLLKQS